MAQLIMDHPGSGVFWPQIDTKFKDLKPLRLLVGVES